MPLFGTRGAASVIGFGGLAKLGYLLRNSLRFRASGSTTLSRAPASAGNRKTWTMSFWFKRGKLGATASAHGIMGCYAGVNNDPNNFEFRFTQSDTLNVVLWDSGAISNAVFRDPAAWYHIVLVLDTTQAGTSSGSKIKLYVNGVLQSWASDSISSGISQDADLIWNSTTTQFFGRWQASDGGNYFLDGYMAEVNFIDGQALTPSSFGKTDNATGQWIPIKYSGTYGTNGYYLPFTNTTSTSTLGNDFSGNGNTWTVNNFSLTAGATYDSMTDVPTLTSATAANYATLNPLLYAPSYGYRDLTNGNLTTIGTSGTNNGNDYSTQTMKTGMWYAEFTCTVGTTSTYPQVGIISVASAGTGTGQVGYVANSAAYFADGTKQINNSQTSYGNSFTTNDVIGVAVDADNGAIYFGKQTGGTGSIVWQNSGVPTSGASKTGAAWTWTGGSIEFFFSTAVYTTSNGWHVNFGQRPFSSTPPSGFKALNTFNLP